jgi:diguanylate cyclase (GGDEF)-like protein
MKHLHDFKAHYRVGIFVLGLAAWSSLPVWALPLDIPLHQLSESTWSAADGLPHSSGKSLLQARSGVLWVGTQSGLARFDGMEFEVFKSAAHPGLGHDYIRYLHEDQTGRIWIATNRGISLYENGEIRSLAAPGTSTGRVFSLVEEPDSNRLWLATQNGLFLADANGLERHPVIDQPVFSLALTGQGQLLVGSRGRIWQVIGEQVIEHVFPADESELVAFTLLIHDGELIQGLSTGGGLRRAPVDDPTAWTDQALSDDYILSLLVDQAGSLWIATNSGLKRQRPGDTYPMAVRTRYLGDSDWVWQLMQDHEGNLWIGYQSGIIRLSTSAFRRFDAMDGLVNGPVWSYFSDPEQNVWAGTDAHGAFRLSGHRFEQILAPESLPHPTVNGFLIDRDHRFWLATMRGVAWFEWPELVPISVPAELPETSILGMTEGQDGRIWLAARPGLYWWLDGEIVRMGEAQGLTQSLTNDVLEDSQGQIWVATDSGVFRGDAEGFKAIGADVGLPEYTASALFEFEGQVWAVLGGPMVRFVGDQAILYADFGLGASMGSLLALDQDRYLWSATHEGIQRMPIDQFDEIDQGLRDRLDIETFGRLSDPIIAQCIGGQGQSGLFQVAENVLWCPTYTGALHLDLRQATVTPEAPLPRLRSLRSERQSYPLDFVSSANLVLPPGSRDLEIGFTGLHLRHPEGVRYRYRLHGFDNTWQDSGRRRSAFYTNLPPGGYRFEVHARNPRGIESSRPAVLELYLSPRPHETMLARILLLIGLLGLLFAIWRYSVRQLRRRQLLLEMKVTERTRQLDEANRQLREASLTDPLTGLRNRRFLGEHLPQDIARVDRAWSGADPSRQVFLTFMMLDLDHFKRINDTHGHRVGDQVLQGFATLLVEQARESDYTVRLGGEEFLLVARHEQPEQILPHVERIIDAVRHHEVLIDGIRLGLRCSIGMASYPALPSQPKALDWESVLELADAATYLAKNEGRDRWLHIELSDQCQAADFMQRLRRDGVTALVASGELAIEREKIPNAG